MAKIAVSHQGEELAQLEGNIRRLRQAKRAGSGAELDRLQSERIEAHGKLEKLRAKQAVVLEEVLLADSAVESAEQERQVARLLRERLGEVDARAFALRILPPHLSGRRESDLILASTVLHSPPPCGSASLFPTSPFSCQAPR